ncbi:MAG: dTDP-4-dehydrorhamnose reductase [Brevundimonas sp.]|uniref:dTDP-4-dehydrorhamnose reductase n=1 Tax=Brevundimonas sp. TaxID=1871086 RepID=UPI00391C9867
MAEPRHILITGGAGQVGLELQAHAWPDGVVVHAPGRDDLDLTDPVSVRAAFAARPYAAVINAAAWTAVDKAEDAVADAFLANAQGPAVLAEATRQAGVPLVHISTDYVFDGSANRPYVESDPVGPLGVYGASKLAGELAIRSGNPRSVVLRTAWLISAHRANFLKTMLTLAKKHERLAIVRDQIGCPTAARDLTEALVSITLRLMDDQDAPTGVYHFVNAGETSWAGLAREIMASSRTTGGAWAEVDAITTDQYPTPAKRPANSRLNTTKLSRDFGIQPRDWRAAVAEIVAELNKEIAR